MEHFPGAQLPDTIAVITVGSVEEWQISIINCVRAAGFSASPLDHDGISYPLPPPGEEEQNAVAQYICLTTYQMQSDPLKSI